MSKWVRYKSTFIRSELQHEKPIRPWIEDLLSDDDGIETRLSKTQSLLALIVSYVLAKDPSILEDVCSAIRTNGYCHEIFESDE